MKKTVYQWKLKPFLFGVLVLSNIFFLLLMTTAIYISASHYFTKQITEARLDVIYNNQLKLSERLKDIESTALAISTDRILKSELDGSATPDLYDYIYFQRDISQWLDSYTYIKPFINSIQIYTDRFKQYERIGQVGSNLILPLSRIPWQEEMDQFEQRDAVWLPAHEDRYSEYRAKPVLTYVLKMYNRHGGLSGYVAVNLAEESLERLFFSESKEASPTNRSLMLADSHGRLMSRMSASVNAPLLDSLQPFVGQIGDPSGFRQVNLGSSPYLMIYSGQNQDRWRIVEFLEADELYRDVKRIRNITLIIGVIVVLMIVPVSSFLAHWIIRPVASLMRGFHRIESGNFHANKENHFIVEFNKLLHGFHHMSQRLQGMLDELDRKNRLKRDLELAVLQSQINPHFLYNTLDMINWAAAMRGNTEVSTMAIRLAKLFRISLSGGGTFIQLHEELEHARLYAQIQQTRMKDRFSYTEQIDPLLKPCYVPKILLQPFIENSIIHGFSAMREGKEEVAVSASLAAPGRIRLVVADNGAGLRREEEGEAVRKRGSMYVSGSGGYGIKNVRERLELYLGSDYELRIEACEPQGVRVSITLPYIDSPEKLKKYRNEREGADS